MTRETPIYIGLLIFAAFLTVALETPFFYRRTLKTQGYRAAFLLANTVTNLSLNFLNGFLFPLVGIRSVYNLFLLIAEEIVVIFIEYAVFRHFDRGKGLLLTVFLANLFSATLGSVGAYFLMLNFSRFV